MAKSDDWAAQVAKVVKAIPRGKVLSYAEVALRANKPGAARAVVRALHALDDVPWWRVLRSDGTVAPQMMGKQAPRLKREGVQLEGRRVPRTARLR
jgi:methylated-DNA-protein-cysteine methyltransferase-like protein